MALKATKIGIEEFLKSSVWADLKDILIGRIDLCKEELGREYPDEDVYMDIRRVAKNRGRLSELQFLRLLPEYLLEQYEILNKLEEEGEEDAG